MAEIRIRRVPEELKLELKAEAKRRGVDVRAVMLFRLWGLNGPPHMGHAQAASEGKVEAPKGASRGTWVFQGQPGRKEFEAEALEWHRSKGYTFSFERWLGHYDSNGGKVGKNAMKSWKGSMVTFEGNRAEMEPQLPLGGGYGGQQQEPRLSASEERVNRSRQNIVDAFTAGADVAAGPDGKQREGGAIKRLVR